MKRALNIFLGLFLMFNSALDIATCLMDLEAFVMLFRVAKLTNTIGILYFYLALYAVKLIATAYAGILLTHKGINNV